MTKTNKATKSRTPTKSTPLVTDVAKPKPKARIQKFVAAIQALEQEHGMMVDVYQDDIRLVDLKDNNKVFAYLGRDHNEKPATAFYVAVDRFYLMIEKRFFRIGDDKKRGFSRHAFLRGQEKLFYLKVLVL